MESNVDELLPLSRRLDWRFLLPDPTLNQVAYTGPSESHLLRALERLSREIIRDPRQPADIAVLVDPTLPDFMRSIRISSRFYVELHRPSVKARLSQFPIPGNFLRAAATAGFTANAYWHYPDFEAATRIIPLSVATPLLSVVAKNRQDTKTRIKTAGMGLFLESGLLARTIPCLSIIGFKK